MKRLKNYASRFRQIEGLGRKAGVTSLFLFRNALKIYYKCFGGLDYNRLWKETRSTKIKLPTYKLRSTTKILEKV